MITFVNNTGYGGTCDNCGRDVAEEFEENKVCWCCACTPKEGQELICEDCKKQSHA